MPVGTLRSILHQAHISIDEWDQLGCTTNRGYGLATLNASGSYSRCTNCAVNPRKRILAWNWYTGLSVPVTWKDARNPARLPIATRFSNVRNFRYAIPVSRVAPSASFSTT